jgi:hypothetical protein
MVASSKLVKQPQVSFPLAWVLGFILLQTTLSYTSIWFPINISIHIVVLGACIALVAFNYALFIDKWRSWRLYIKKMPRIHLWGLTIILLLVLEKSTFALLVPDDGFYHLQAIRWLEEYGTVPGLGNVISRLGFNSQWYVSCAFASLPFMNGGVPMHSITGLFCAIMLLLAYIFLVDTNKSFIIKAIAVALVLPICFNIKYISSLGNDLPLMLLYILYILLAVECRFAMRKNVSSLLLLLLPSFLISVKLSAMFLGLFCTYMLYVFIKEKRYKYMVAFATLTVLVLLPFLVKNILISGYLIYPLPAVDVLNVDWKVPNSIAQTEKDAVEIWAKSPGSIDQSVLQQSFSQWVPHWFNGLQVWDWALLLLVVISLGAYMYSAFQKNIVQVIHVCMIYIYIHLAIWFIAAPDPRFAYGPLFIAIAIPFGLLLDGKIKHSANLLVLGVLLFLCSFVLFTKKMEKYSTSSFLERLYEPTKIKTPSVFVFSKNNHALYLAANPAGVGYSPLPAVSDSALRFIYRGSSINDGFMSLEK